MPSNMHVCVLLVALLTLRPCHASGGEVSWTLCQGSELLLHIYSNSKVTFVPSSPPGPKRPVFAGGLLSDPRFVRTTRRRLVLREVTPSDEGVYHLVHDAGRSSVTVHLGVSECLQSYQAKYGENFQHPIPTNGYLLEFSPMGSPPEAEPLLLWNRTDPLLSLRGRGQVQSNGELWVVRRVNSADQGNYTVRSQAGNLISRTQLTLQGYTFNVTRLSKELLTLALFVPAHEATLTFTAVRAPNDPRPRRDPVALVRDGHVLDLDVNFKDRVAVYSYDDKVAVAELSPRHSGLYEVRDRHGHLVASTRLVVIDKVNRWRVLLRSFAGPIGLILALASLSLLVKRYPDCIKISRCLLCQNRRPAARPRVIVRDYSPHVHQPSGSYAGPQQPGTPRKWSPKASPSHTAGTPVAVDLAAPSYPSNARAVNQWAAGLAGPMPAHPAPTNIGGSFHTEQGSSFSLPWAADSLHTSEDCVQFQSRRDKENRSRGGKTTFSTLPLDVEAAEVHSVYTSDKLNFS